MTDALPQAAPLPPLPADDGSCRIEIYGPPIDYIYGTLWNSSYWSDNAVWGGWVNPGLAWRDITPEALNVQITWGTDDPAGALSIVAAGSWSITTYDPKRLLDPSNWWSELENAINPGGLIRVMYKNTVVRHGFIDEVAFDLATLTGSIRASDGISLMANAKVAEGLQHDPTVPNTLRARARWVLEKAQVKYIRVEDDPTGQNDPVVGMLIDRESSVWQQINAAAFDCLYACWLDHEGILRFRSYGRPIGSGITLGAYGIPLDTIKVRQTLESVFNHARARRVDWNNDVYAERIGDSVDIYGDLLISRDRQNPLADQWVNHVVDDRGAFKTQYELGTIRFQTEAQFLSVLDLGMMDEVLIRSVSVPEAPILTTGRVLGGRIEANVESGWSGGLITYFPSKSWTPDYIEDHMGIARFDVTKNREIYTTNAGGNYGRTGQPLHIRARVLQPDGAAADETTIVLLDVAPIDWSNIASILDANLRVFGYPHEHDPGTTQYYDLEWLTIYRIDAAWDENTVWPGPAKTQKYSYQMANKHMGWLEMDVEPVLWDWAPVEMTGAGLPQYGIALASYYPTFTQPLHFDLNDRSNNQKPYIYLRHLTK